MSELSSDVIGPRCDFSSSLDKEIEVRLRCPDYAARLQLKESFRGRLVGYERFGIWVEPAEMRKTALADQGEVAHFFFPWAEILTVVRHQESSLFQSKKEYRGLRPG